MKERFVTTATQPITTKIVEKEQNQYSISNSYYQPDLGRVPIPVRHSVRRHDLFEDDNAEQHGQNDRV